MPLTNKSTGRYFWREAGNRLFVEIDGKPVELKYTLAQHEAYQNFIDEQKAGFDAAVVNAEQKLELQLQDVLKNRINKSIDYAAGVLEVALNPKHDRQFTREQLKELFGEQLDLMQIVASTYVDKKIFNPVLDAMLDPHLAPGSRGA